MSGLVFAPGLLSIQGAGIASGTRAAACLLTGYSPHGARIAPGDMLIPLQPVHSQFDRTPVRDYNFFYLSTEAGGAA